MIYLAIPSFAVIFYTWLIGAAIVCASHGFCKLLETSASDDYTFGLILRRSIFWFVFIPAYFLTFDIPRS